MYNQEIAVQKSPVNGFLEHKTKGLNHPQQQQVASTYWQSVWDRHQGLVCVLVPSCFVLSDTLQMAPTIE
ncbi:hypothetical protein OUZ56_015612 [Daphnia magna]|uniref:Uncharacterized protein n=1 Tax=Daphnia magna TaxID=35525 RepID=A0ABR0ANB1_9CRUS|nr:hypothetical protein OUZ56_015612 [Daphnia magna]